MTFFEGFSRPRSCAAPPAAAAAVRKKGVDRLDAPTSPTGAPIFLSRRQCPRRLGKNLGYTTSPRSALPTDGEANTGGRTADPSARHRDPRSGLRGTRTAQRPAKVAHPLAPGVTGASAASPAAVAPAPPRPAAPPALRMLMGRRKILFYFPRIMSHFRI